MFVPGKNSVPITATFTALSFVSCYYAADNAEKTPNVVFIHIDDLGWTDLGYMGSNFYETPNIDNLAATGLVFTNAYASAANCAPSRANLFYRKKFSQAWSSGYAENVQLDFYII